MINSPKTSIYHPFWCYTWCIPLFTMFKHNACGNWTVLKIFPFPCFKETKKDWCCLWVCDHGMLVVYSWAPACMGGTAPWLLPTGCSSSFVGGTTGRFTTTTRRLFLAVFGRFITIGTVFSPSRVVGSVRIGVTYHFTLSTILVMSAILFTSMTILRSVPVSALVRVTIPAALKVNYVIAITTGLWGGTERRGVWRSVGWYATGASVPTLWTMSWSKWLLITAVVKLSSGDGVWGPWMFPTSASTRAWLLFCWYRLGLRVLNVKKNFH